MQCALRDIQFFFQSMGNTINAYDLHQHIYTFHGSNEPNAKEILDERFVKVLNEDIQAAS